MDERAKEDRIFIGCILAIVMTIFLPPLFLIGKNVFKEDIEAYHFKENQAEHLKQEAEKEKKRELETCIEKWSGNRIKDCTPLKHAK